MLIKLKNGTSVLQLAFKTEPESATIRHKFSRVNLSSSTMYKPRFIQIGSVSEDIQ